MSKHNILIFNIFINRNYEANFIFMGMEIALILLASHMPEHGKWKNLIYHNGHITKDRRPFGHS